MAATNSLSRILLVEDNPGDVELTKLAFETAGIDCILDTASSGELALSQLEKISKLSPGDIPRVILLDLNLPGMGGLSLLEWLKSDDRFRRIPVVMLSSSVAAEDIRNSYDLSANSYVQKPSSMRDFVEIAKSIETFWLRAPSLA